MNIAINSLKIIVIPLYKEARNLLPMDIKAIQALSKQDMDAVNELILALDSTLEGDATTLFRRAQFL